MSRFCLYTADQRNVGEPVMNYFRRFGGAGLPRHERVSQGVPPVGEANQRRAARARWSARRVSRHALDHGAERIRKSGWIDSAYLVDQLGTAEIHAVFGQLSSCGEDELP